MQLQSYPQRFIQSAFAMAFAVALLGVSGGVLAQLE